MTVYTVIHLKNKNIECTYTKTDKYCTISLIFTVK